MDKETLYELIEAYLAGNLPAEERALLEQQMATNPDIAAEVRLHRRLAEVVSDKAKLDFAQKSAQVAEEFPEPNPSAGTLPWGMYILILMIAIGLWKVFTMDKSEQKSLPAPPAVIQDSLREDKAPAPPSEALTDTLPSEQQPPQPKPIIPARNPFLPNPALEKETSQPRDVYVSVEAALLEAFPGKTAGTYQIRFTGRLLTALEPPELEFVLLDNSLPNSKQMLRIPVSITLLEDADRFRAFAAKKAYEWLIIEDFPLPDGLYYGRLSVKGNAASLWTGKLILKK